MTTSKPTPDTVRAALLDLSAAAPGGWFTAAEIAGKIEGATASDVMDATSCCLDWLVEGKIDVGEWPWSAGPATRSLKVYGLKAYRTTVPVIAYKSTLDGKREYLFIFEDEDGPTLAYLPTHLTDEQVVAFCETCGWSCCSIER